MTAGLRSLPSLLFLFCLASAEAAPAASSPSCTPAQIDNQWNRIVQAVANARRIERDKNCDRIVFMIASKRAHTSLSAAISVAPKGKFLDRAEYARAYAAAGEDQRRRMFPAGGKRAMLTSIFFGPGGSSAAIVSTTFDDRYDVKIVVADSGSARLSGDEKFFDVFALNWRLHRAYEAANRGR
jgi:hypothetical protein